MIKYIILGLMMITISSCSIPTQYERDPADAGFGRDDVKKSRCVCREFYKNGNWL